MEKREKELGKRKRKMEKKGKENGEKGAHKISAASKKRKSGVEKSLELVLDKFK